MFIASGWAVNAIRRWLSSMQEEVAPRRRLTPAHVHRERLSSERK
jgi:hypothetical protein